MLRHGDAPDGDRGATREPRTSIHSQSSRGSDPADSLAEQRTAVDPAAFRDHGLDLLPQHAAMLAASLIAPEVARARGYSSITDVAALEPLEFQPYQRRVPGLVVPISGVDGGLCLHQYRPDSPRRNAEGSVVKYESPAGARNVIDVPRPVFAQIGNPTVPLVVTEGAKKADAGVSAGYCTIALMGVWGWLGTNEHGGRTALPDWRSIALKGRSGRRDVYLAFDSDAETKPEVYRALTELKAFLERRGARVRNIRLPQEVA